jgi:PadR family transcriptional regulator, regulatory protein AphA
MRTTTNSAVDDVDASAGRTRGRRRRRLMATDDSVGRRRRTRYTITAKGRRALAGSLQEPGEGPALESEQLLKIHFADSGTKADVLVNLQAARAWVLEQNRENLTAARAYLAGEGPFPERAALNQLGGRFLTDFYVTVARWVHWATDVVDGWPDDVRDAPFDVAAAQEGVDVAESIDVLLRSPTRR